MDFRSEDTRRSVTLSAFLLRGLKAAPCDFLRENRSRAGALSKQGFLPCPFIVMNNKRRTQNPSKSLKKPLWGQKDNDIPQVRYFNVNLTLISIHTKRYIVIGEAKGKSCTVTIK